MQETANLKPVGTKHEICLDENLFGVGVFIISLLALILSALPFTLYPLERLEIISIKSYYQILGRPVFLSLWGWIPGLGLAVLSLFMVRRSRSLLKFLIWVVSSLAIIVAFFLWLALASYLLMWSIGPAFH